MNKNIDKQELFERMPVPKAVANLAVPSIMASLVMILYNLADTYFVGYLNSPVQNAAVTLAAPVLLAFNAVNNLFGIGSSSAMSRNLGAKKFEDVYKSAAFGIYCAFICGVIFSVGYTLFRGAFLRVLGADSVTEDATKAYLFWTVSCGAIPAIMNVVISFMVRAEGSAMHASVGTMSGCLLNIILDPIFIMPWGLNMGAAGAGCATFIANCFACVYYLVYIITRRGKSYVCIDPRMARCGRAVAFGILAVGIPAAIQNLLNVTGMTILNNFTAEFGSEAVAAMGIAHKIEMIPFYVAMGVTSGVMPLIGYNYAAKNPRRMKHALVFTGRMSIAGLTVMMILFWTFSKNIIGAFIQAPAVVSYGTAFLRGMALGMPLLGLDFLGVMLFNACGMGKTALAFAIMRKIVLEIPALFILNYFFPLYGLAYAQTLAELVLAIVSVFMMIKIFKDVEKKCAA